MSALYVAAYVACGALAYGFTYSEFSRMFPTPEAGRHRPIARIMALIGPAGLLVAVLMREKPLRLQYRHREVTR
jgi:hypothetical protein